VPCPTGGPAAGVALSVTDVGKPACAHGRTKLIAQVFNGFGNSRVIFKAKILMHLAIMRISDISVIKDITDIKVIKRIKRMKS
jgi:hypothetical protein